MNDQGEVMDDPGDPGHLPMMTPAHRGFLALVSARHEHNIDTATEDGKAAMLRTAAKASFGWKSGMPSRTMTVRYWRVHENLAKPGTRAASYGPARMVLVDVSGETFATFSRAAITSLGLAVGMYGYDAWDPPVQVRITREVGGEFGEWMNVEFIGRQPANNKRK